MTSPLVSLSLEAQLQALSKEMREDADDSRRRGYEEGAIAREVCANMVDALLASAQRREQHTCSLDVLGSAASCRVCCGDAPLPEASASASSPASAPTTACADCGVALNDGEAKCFTVCEACWRKVYPAQPASPERETLRAIRERLHPTDQSYCAEPLDIEESRWLLTQFDAAEQRSADLAAQLRAAQGCDGNCSCAVWKSRHEAAMALYATMEQLRAAQHERDIERSRFAFWAEKFDDLSSDLDRRAHVDWGHLRYQVMAAVKEGAKLFRQYAAGQPSPSNWRRKAEQAESRLSALREWLMPLVRRAHEEAVGANPLFSKAHWEHNAGPEWPHEPDDDSYLAFENCKHPMCALLREDGKADEKASAT